MKSAETVSAIRNACGYIKDDARIAAFYGVTEKEVAAIRRSRPTPRRMMQHEPIEERSLHNDELRAEVAEQQCAAHLARLWAYYTKKGRKLGLTPAEYGLLANHMDINAGNVALVKGMGLR